MRRGGFTLVELLVVMSVIALLGALLLPVTMRVRGTARQIQCVSNLGQLGKALTLYTDDNDHWYPCAACMPSTEPKDGLPRIRDLLESHASPEVFECPDDKPTDPEYTFGTYYEGEGSSYEWAEICNHLKVGMAITFAPFRIEDVPILRDYEPFHKRGGGKLGLNFLFVDTRVESY